jgi:hypothetical protein
MESDINSNKNFSKFFYYQSLFFCYYLVDLFDESINESNYYIILCNYDQKFSDKVNSYLLLLFVWNIQQL